MTWTDPEAGKAFFETDDQPTEANFETYILDNLLSVEHVLDVTTGDLDVNTSTAETAFYSVVVPANSMGSNGEVHMQTWGDARGNTSGDCTLTTRVKFGGSTHYTLADSGWVNNTVRTFFGVDIRIINQGATNAQLVVVGIVGAGPDGGGTNSLLAALPATAAIDTTVDQTLLVSVQWGSSSANNSVRRLSAKTTLARN